MMTRSRTLANVLRLRPLLFCGACLVASSAQATPGATIDREFRAAYPTNVPSSTTPIAGVALSRFAVSGLAKSARSERAFDDGGIVLSLADRAGVVRVVVQLSVAPDASAARHVLDAELHGVSTALSRASDATLGDLSWADDGGRGTTLVLGTQANLAYSVNVIAATPNLPTAAGIAQLLRKAMVQGAPAFPAASVSVPQAIDKKQGGIVSVSVPGGYPYTLRADGGYIARKNNAEKGQAIVRPFAAGPVIVYATIVDDLSRVTVARAVTRAE